VVQLIINWGENNHIIEIFQRNKPFFAKTCVKFMQNLHFFSTADSELKYAEKHNMLATVV
jgi:hypothetical protein